MDKRIRFLVIAVMAIIVLVGSAWPQGLSVSQAQTSLAEGVLFADNFDDGNADGWTISGDNAGWNVREGNFGGRLEGRWRNSFASAGDPSWTNYVFEADVLAEAGVAKCLLFHYRDANNNYGVVLRGLYSGRASVSLFKREAGVWTADIKEHLFPNVLNIWYHLKISLEGRRIRVWVNNVFCIDHVDQQTTLTSGKVALIIHTGEEGVNAVRFDNVEVRGLQEAVSLSLSPIQVEEGPYPFLPNQITLKTTVTNQGPVEARNVRVQFFKGHPNSGGIQMGESNHGNIPQGESREASLLWELGGNLEGATVYIRAICDNQQMGNAEASMVSTPLSVYYTDFRLNRDAYRFCNNWTYERREFVEDLKIIMEASDEGGPLASFATLVWIYMRQQLEKGYCYGMSLSSARYWQNPSLKPVPNLSTYELNKEVAKAGIEAYQRRVFWGNALYMVTSGVKPETEWKFRWDLEYNLLISSLKNGRPSVMRVPGHATLAYKLVNTGPESRVYVYDPSRTIMPTQGCVALDSPPAYGTFYSSNKTFRYELDNANACWVEEVSPYFAPLWSVARNLFRLIVADLTGRARTVLAFGSPVEPLVVDQYGRRLGLISGSVVSEIPEAEFYQFEEDKFFLLPAQLRYAVSAVGLGEGTMDLGVILPRDADQAECTGYEDVPVIRGSVARMSISQDMTDWGLQTDWGVRQPDTRETVRIHKVQLPLLYKNRDATSQPTPTPTVTAVPTATNTPSPSPTPTVTRPPTSTPIPNDGKVWGKCYRAGTWELVEGECVKIGPPNGNGDYGGSCTDRDGVYKFDFLQRPDPVTRYGVWLARNPGDIRVANLTEGQKVVQIDFTVP